MTSKLKEIVELGCFNREESETAMTRSTCRQCQKDSKGELWVCPHDLDVSIAFDLTEQTMLRDQARFAAQASAMWAALWTVCGIGMLIGYVALKIVEGFASPQQLGQDANPPGFVLGFYGGGSVALLLLAGFFLVRRKKLDRRMREIVSDLEDTN